MGLIFVLHVYEWVGHSFRVKEYEQNYMMSRMVQRQLIS
jgi:hypothetical protein